MPSIESLALQTGGSIGTLVVLILLLRPIVSRFFDSLIRNQDKTVALQERNIEVLSEVTEQMKSHEVRAQKRADWFHKRMNIVEDQMKAWQECMDKRNIESDQRVKEYGDTMVKLYNFLAEKAGHTVKK